MTLARPYRRTCRQLADGSYTHSGNGRYVAHPAYATSPEHYVRAFQIIQKDLEELFDYVEPSDQNLACHSFRIHELLLRACIEVEANCKAILTENGLVLRDNPNMLDYRKVEASHKLSGYEVSAPTWHGDRAKRKPFANWANPPGEQTLPWYDAYNKTKHNRATRFHEATFEHMFDAVCGLVVLLSAQFLNEDFSNNHFVGMSYGDEDAMETAIGGYFRVSFPDWPEAERYEFDWRELGNEDDPFVNFPYP
jgi:hypothetical protein